MFHVSLLPPVAYDPLLGQNLGPVLPLATSEEDPEYEVEWIISSFWYKGEINHVVR